MILTIGPPSGGVVSSRRGSRPAGSCRGGRARLGRRGVPGEEGLEAGVREMSQIIVIELPTVTVTLGNYVSAINFCDF